MNCISKNCSAKVEEEYPQEEYWNGCMLVGEAPGKEEHRRKIPFVGDSGKDLDNYLRVIGQSRLHFYTTNICKCFVQGNPDPTPHQVLECTTKYLIPELEYLKPEVIGAMGLIAVRWFLDMPATPNEDYPTPLKMEEVHGIPFLSPRGPWVVVPIYHPASGLRFPDRMLDIRRDFQQLKLQITGGDGKLKPRVDISGKKYNQKYNYSANGCTSKGGIPAIDTETDGLHGKFWCMSYSNGSRSGGVIRNPIPHTVPKAIFHNAIYDIPVLKKVNVNVREWVCTMTMAYLLQLPQSLKLLSYRLLNIRMEEYGDVVGVAGEGKALTYLCGVLGKEWPNPEPLLTWNKGQPHIKKPQNIAKKVDRMIKDKVKGERGKRDPVSLYTRWNNIKPDEGRGTVEEVLGVMPEGYLGDIPLEKAIQYAGLDADVTRQLYPILQSKIKEEELEEVLDRDMRMMPLVLDMMEAGIKIEGEYIENLSTKYRLRMSEIENNIHTTIADIWEGHFNPGSPKQTGELMLRLGLLEKKYGKLPSTEAKYLEAVRHKHPVVGMILDWRGYKKLDSTYVSVLPKLADEGGRIHTTFKTTRTATGRLASENPNLMNQPVRSTEGKELRNGFVAGEGCVLVSFDFAQIELKILAHVSGDENMIKIFRSGGDIHSMTAASMFRIPLSEVDKDKHRRPAKSVAFGIVYGITAMGLFMQFELEGVEGWTVRSCQGLIDGWLDTYPGVRGYTNIQHTMAKRYGKVWDLFGRVRYIPEVLSSREWVVESGLRKAGNTPIQSGAQGVIKEGMAQLVPECKKWRRMGYTVNPLIQIHDDLLFEIGQKEAVEVVPRIKHIMEHVVELDVETPVDCKAGKRWGSMKDVDVGGKVETLLRKLTGKGEKKGEKGGR